MWEVQATGAARRRPALHGLAVGIGPYQDQALSLEYGDDDAAAFAAALKAAGRGLFRAVDVRPLVNQQATLAGITQAFGAVAAKAGPEDVFVLFLAGHGLVQDGRYHFIPWDLRYTNRKALRAGSLHEDRLRDLLAQVQARKSLIVIDSCHAGALLGDGLRLAALYRGGPALEHRAAIDRLMAKTGRAMLASTTERKFALEGLDGHGVFTHVLLEGLRGQADLLGNDNRTIETSELADYLEEEVPRISHRVWRYEQHPMRDLQGQSFPIGLRRRGSEP
ncbi:caspase family protein [Candidatus Thiosymbion oneisti]|uniref:caspase family protein n=1 Tax=Candidatus Thiosymbion oneisti TaxID=589554 RepID=UPI000A7C98BE|nr:caspase family protein [Candidatus Thiosymbion oneisti]